MVVTRIQYMLALASLVLPQLTVAYLNQPELTRKILKHFSWIKINSGRITQG